MTGVARFDSRAFKGVLVGMATGTVPVIALMGSMVQAARLHRYFARTILMIFGSMMANFANIL
jgi:hypothetical protein